MKKNYSLTSTIHKPERHLELLKHEINKYIGRERRKTLPEDSGFWDFDCKCGPDEASAVSLHVSTIGKHIDEVAAKGATNVYIEILAKPGIKKPKESAES
jgi:hypothetical protein